MSTLRNRLFDILSDNTPDRLPWFADLSYWHLAMSTKGTLDKRYEGLEGSIKLYEDLGVGYYYPGVWPYAPVYKNCEVTEVERKSTNYSVLNLNTTIIEDKNNNDIIREVITPLGRLKERWIYSPTSFCWAPQEYLIKTAEDLKIFKYWINNTEYKTDYRPLTIAKDLIGEQGCLVCPQNASPLADLFHRYVGVETTVNLMFDNRTLFEEVMEILDRKADESLEIALNAPGAVIVIGDNLASDIVGKNLFEEFLRPGYEKWNKRIKAGNKYSLIHMDGALKGLLKEVSKVNFSAIEAMTPKPAGDLAADEFEDYVKSDSIMWGGIPGILFTPFFSDRYFEDYVIEVIEIMAAKPKYILGIGDEIPPDGIIGRIKKVTDLVEKYGKYKG